MTSRGPCCFSQRFFLLGALVVASGCTGSDDGASDSPSSAGTAAAAAGAGGTLQPSAGGSSSGGSGSEGPGGGGTSAGAAGTGQPDINAGGGSSALGPRLRRYHRSDADRSIRFELDATEGLAPYPSSLEYLRTFVARALDKPDGVVFESDETLAPLGTDHVWTFEALDAFARAHAADDENGPVSIHVLLVDGSYDSGDGGGTVLGLAWGQRYIALFQDAIRSGCSGGLLGGLSADACQIAERNVWAHEIGHVIGLVDNGITQQMEHRDADRGRHDEWDGCLMYWAYDRPEIFDALLARFNNGQSTDVDFCENCWADLNAARQ